MHSLVTASRAAQRCEHGQQAGGGRFHCQRRVKARTAVIMKRFRKTWRDGDEKGWQMVRMIPKCIEECLI